MFDLALGFFNSRSSGEQVLMLFAAGVVLHWAGIQVGELIGMLTRS